MIKAYKVAQHIFRLSVPDSHPLWGAMGAYEPFETSEESDAIFSLSMAESMEDTDMTPYFVEKSEEKGSPRIELYKTASGWVFKMAPLQEMEVCCRLATNEDFTEGTFCSEPSRSATVFALNNSLMLMYAFRTASLGTLEMHSSVVMKDGRGYMFLGKSGTGKSTHSRQWLENIPGTELLNDDNPVIRVMEDGIVRVFGSPWSGKTPCYKALDVPVGAIVRIRQCPENKIHRYSLVEAYASVYSSCSGLKSDRRIADGLHSTIESVVTGVPCYILDCRPDKEAAMVCYGEVK